MKGVTDILIISFISVFLLIACSKSSDPVSLDEEEWC
jgi:hypothetical protein